MRSLRALSAFIALLCVAPAIASAQTPKIENLQLDATAFPDVKLRLDIRSSTGGLISGLPPESFSIVENELPVPVEVSSGAGSGGAAYLFVVDTSGSMRHLLGDIRGDLASFLESMRPVDQMGLITFNDQVQVVQSFTNDRSQLTSAVSSLQVGGRSTELYYAVYEGLELLEQPGLPPRRVLVVISDGRDEGTAYTLNDCIERANSGDVDILSIGISSGEPGALLNLERMARLTEGLFLRFEEGQDWAAKFDSIVEHVNSRYSVRWSSTLPTDGVVHEALLEVRIEDLTITRDLAIETPLIVPPEPAVPKWVIGVAAGTLLFVSILVAFWLRSKRRVARLENSIDTQRASAEEVQRRLDEQLGAVSASIGRLEDNLNRPVVVTQPAPAAPVSGAAAPQTAPSKRKTMFQPSNEPSGGTAYARGRVDVIDGPMVGAKLQLLPGRTTIGRESDNNIVLNDDRASSHHAVISHENGIFWIEDLGSTNGTFVNERLRLSNRHPLISGETIRIGGSLLRFVGEA